jgi:ankyrin repeat protein
MIDKGWQLVKTSPLNEAAWKGDTEKVQAPEKVQALLTQGADVNAKDKGGFTALMDAAWEGHTDTVQALLAQGADVNAKNKNGDTALMLAKEGGHKEIVHILKEAGAKE